MYHSDCLRVEKSNISSIVPILLNADIGQLHLKIPILPKVLAGFYLSLYLSVYLSVFSATSKMHLPLPG